MTFKPVNTYRLTRQLYLDAVTLGHIQELVRNYGEELVAVVRSREEAYGPERSEDARELSPLGHYTVHLVRTGAARDVRVFVARDGSVRELEEQPA